ncbi:MAG: hypothetical protein ACOX6M_12140 [Armatimonadota bacterium]|jgi:hypothetical protein
MPPELTLRKALKAVVARMRLCILARRMALCLAIGIALSVLMLAAGKTGVLFWLRLDYLPLWYGLAPLLLSVIGGVVWGLWSRISDFQAAHAADRALGLRERLGSAVALSNEPPKHAALLPALIADAAGHCDGLDPKQVTGPLLPRKSLAVPAFGLVLAALWFMPQYNLFASEQEVSEREALRIQGDELEDLAREIRQQAKEAKLERSERFAGRIEALGGDLARGKLSKREAMKEAATLTDEIKAQHRELAESNEVASLRESLADAKAKDLRSKAASEIVDDLAAGDLQAAKQKFQDLQQQIESGTLSEAERQQLANDLDKIGQSLENSSASETGQSMRRASEALREGDNQGASQQLEQAAQELAESAGAQGLSEMQQLEALAREMEFAEEEMAQINGEEGQGGARPSTSGSEQGQGQQGEQGQQGQGGAPGPGEGGRRIGSGHSTDAGVTPFEQPYAGDDETGEGAQVRQYEGGSSKPGVDTLGLNTRVRGQTRDLDDTPSMDVRGVGPRNEASTPYYNVQRPSQAEVESALDRQNIPASERPLVQDYFNEID